MQPSRGRSDATLLPLALALAGQVRTLQEERMRTELFRTVVRPSGAAVFAHLSPEDYAAAWHFGRKNSSSIVAPPTMVPLFDGFEAAFRRQFQPEFFALVADAELERHRRWTGALPGAGVVAGAVPPARRASFEGKATLRAGLQGGLISHSISPISRFESSRCRA